MQLCQKVGYHVNFAYGVAKWKFGSNLRIEESICQLFYFWLQSLANMHTFWQWKQSQLWVLQVKNTAPDKPHHFVSIDHYMST